MKIPNDYVAIPLEEYNFLRDEYARISNTISIVKDWVATEHIRQMRSGFNPDNEIIKTNHLAILLNMDLVREENVDDK